MKAKKTITTSTLTLKGPKGAYFKIEYSPNLITWSALPIIQANDDGNATYIHSSSFSNLYFRASLVRPPNELMQPLKYTTTKPSLLVNWYRKIFPIKRPPVFLDNP